MLGKIFLRAQSDHEVDDEVLLGLSKCEFRTVTFYRFKVLVQVQREYFHPLCKHGKNNQKSTIFHQFHCKLDVPAATTVSKMTHPYL